MRRLIRHRFSGLLGSLGAVCLVALLATSIASAGIGYVPGTEDVPLMPGLVANDGPLVFDQPQGRIVEASAAGPVRRNDVLAFYHDSLPALGWAPSGSRDFDRDGERLDLAFAGHDGALTVNFTLAPH